MNPAYTDEQIAKIRKANPLSEIAHVLGVPLHDSENGSLMGPCPFHPDGGTGSFTILPAAEIFYCFACGEGGDVITLIRKVQGLDFFGAVKMLSGRVGIDAS